MTFQQLEYIISLDNERHFVRAADKCFVTQPTLTTQIIKLEDELGIKLFDRKRFPIQPTKEGQKYILKARQILRIKKELDNFIKKEKENITEDVKIGIISTVAPYLLPKLIPFIKNTYPDVSLKWVEMSAIELLHALQNDIISIAIMSTPLNNPDFKEIHLFSEQLLVYTSIKNPYYKKNKILYNEITPENLITLPYGHCLNAQCGYMLNKLNKELNRNIIYETSSIEALIKMVDSGIGFTILPELSVINDTKSFQIKKIDEPPVFRNISMVVNIGHVREKMLKIIKNSVISILPNKILNNSFKNQPIPINFVH